MLIKRFDKDQRDARSINVSEKEVPISFFLFLFFAYENEIIWIQVKRMNHLKESNLFAGGILAVKVPLYPRRKY